MFLYFFCRSMLLLKLFYKYLENKASSSEDADLVIQLPHLIFNILSFLTVEPGSQVIFVISPLLVETLLWFVDHWSKTYLFAKLGDSGTLRFVSLDVLFLFILCDGERNSYN